jgi:hypothetical protein
MSWCSLFVCVCVCVGDAVNECVGASAEVLQHILLCDYEFFEATDHT